MDNILAPKLPTNLDENNIQKTNTNIKKENNLIEDDKIKRDSNKNETKE